MKTKKIVNLFVRILILITLIWLLQPLNAKAQIGKSCPPCTDDNTNFIIADQDLKDATTEVTRARDAVAKAKEDVRDNQITFDVAVGAAIVACAPEPVVALTCTLALLAVLETGRKLDASIKSLENYERKLDFAMHEKKAADLVKIQRQKELDECKARQNPGVCKKCQGGIVIAEPIGTYISDCEECDGKGDVRPKANIKCPDGSCKDEGTYRVVRTIENCNDTDTNEWITSTPPRAGTTGSIKRHYGENGQVTFCEGQIITTTVTDITCD